MTTLTTLEQALELAADTDGRIRILAGIDAWKYPIKADACTIYDVADAAKADDDDYVVDAANAAEWDIEGALAQTMQRATLADALALSLSYEADVALIDALRESLYPIALQYDRDSADCIVESAELDYDQLVLFDAATAYEELRHIAYAITRGGRDLDDYYIVDTSTVTREALDAARVTALAEIRAEAADETYQAREARAKAEADREEYEIMDRDETESRAMDRGETVEYFGGDDRAAAAKELGMPEDSQTVDLYFRGMIHAAEAQRRAEKIIHRHEKTDYDALLARGIDRDTARSMI